MNRSFLTFLSLSLAAAPLLAQESIEQRLDRLERENRALAQRLDGVTGAKDAGYVGQEPESQQAEPGFRKVYGTDAGLSIAGYGEYVFQQRSGRTDVADALRTVLYVGYHFDDEWLFHSEIELEHGTTDDSSGTTTSRGEVSLEFGYLEYQACDWFSLRTGMVLMPVGLVNEQHEPTTFLPVSRSQTESRIVPTTWRELGIEGLATFGDVDVRAFVGTGLDGEEFDESGLRGGRQKGNRAAADDFAAALRADWRCAPEVTVGASGVYQKAGQDGTDGTVAIPELDTVIAEAHVDWRPGPFVVRGLWASAFSDDAAQFGAATGTGLAERMDGFYGEVGCDVAPWIMPESRAALIPFVRFEQIDTQAKMPSGVAADPTRDNRIVTFGVNLRPNDQIVFKVDFEEWDNSYDRFNISMGYVF